MNLTTVENQTIDFLKLDYLAKTFNVGTSTVLTSILLHTFRFTKKHNLNVKGAYAGRMNLFILYAIHYKFEVLHALLGYALPPEHKALRYTNLVILGLDILFTARTAYFTIRLIPFKNIDISKRMHLITMLFGGLSALYPVALSVTYIFWRPLVEQYISLYNAAIPVLHILFHLSHLIFLKKFRINISEFLHR